MLEYIIYSTHPTIKKQMIQKMDKQYKQATHLSLYR